MRWEDVPVLSDLVRTIIEYSPRVAFALIALTLGWMIGRLVGFLINKVVGKMGLESAFRKTFIGRAILRAGYTPGNFFALLGKGFIYLLSTLSALKLLSIPLVTDSVQAFIEYVPNLIGGILILVVGFTCVDWINESIEKGTSSPLQYNLIGWLVRIAFYFVTITIALAQMKIDITILYIFAQAFAWSLAVAIGVAFGWNFKDRIGVWLEKLTNHKEKAKNAT